MKIGCVVLAGGLARRMGGGDKGLREVGGKPIIERVLDTVAPQVDDLILNANGDPSRFSHLGYPVISDTVDGFVGPLAGVLVGMEHFSACDYVLSVPTDTPFLPDDLVARLRAPLEGEKLDIVMAHSGGFDHPVVALWSVGLKSDLKAALCEEKIRKLKRWVARYRTRSVSWSITPHDPFFNANRPEDLDALKS